MTRLSVRSCGESSHLSCSHPDLRFDYHHLHYSRIGESQLPRVQRIVSKYAYPDAQLSSSHSGRDPMYGITRLPSPFTSTNTAQPNQRYNLPSALKFLLTLFAATTANVRSSGTRPRPTSGSACPLDSSTPSGHLSTTTASMTVLNEPCSLILSTTLSKVLRRCIELSGGSISGSER